MSRRRGVLYVAGALMVIGPPVAWILSSVPASAHDPLAPTVTRNAALASATEGLSALVQRDPMALVRLGQQRYEDRVRAYRCLLVKQEWLGNRMSAPQEIELRFRESPRSVYMLWKSGADQARRALYVRDDAAYRNDRGEPVARVEPNGALARLFIKDLFVPIHGPEAHKASRRTIDEAGFRATFDLLELYNAVAAERGVLDIRSGGTGMVDGRPTYVIVRDLPYAGPSGPYPDARMVMHLDQEWLLPVAIYSYADHAEKQLLGSYVFAQVELNPQFGDDAFQF